ncbi:MAG: DUF1273 family protein [Clostridia bacterium]|nr:DUF1273 family protein [Clostridia bacterium]
MICCVTGHRPAGFPFSREENSIEYVFYQEKLLSEITKLIHAGYLTFIFGVADGADTDFANAVIHLRDNEGYNISLEAALPFPINPSKNPTEKTLDRITLLKMCNRVHTVSPYFHKGCMQKRNEFMVDRADLVLAIWNGIQKGGTWNTIKYGTKKGKAFKYIMLNEFLV